MIANKAFSNIEHWNEMITLGPKRLDLADPESGELRKDVENFKNLILDKLVLFPDDLSELLLIRLLSHECATKFFLSMEDSLVRFVIYVPPSIYESSKPLIYFRFQEAYWWYLDIHCGLEDQLPKLDFNYYIKIAILTNPICQSYVQLAEHVYRYREWKEYMRLIPVRGVIILNEGMDHVLMVQGYCSSIWSFPQGKANQNESDIECALREANEEIGVDLTDCIHSDLYIEVNVPVSITKYKSLKLFLAGAIADSTKFIPMTRFEIRCVDWVPLNVFPAWPGPKPKGYYRNMRIWHTNLMSEKLQVLIAHLKERHQRTLTY